MATDLQAPEGEPGAPAKASTPLIIDVLARWEDQNGSLACVLASEWDALRQEVMDAAVIESPRMARNRLEALAAQPHTAALAARSATAISCLPDAPYKVALQRLHDDMLAAIAALLQAAPVAQWQPIETAPKDGRKLILFYLNRNGKARTVMACWVTDEEAAETDADGVGLEGGWYERIDNWDEYSQVAIHEGEPSHWMPLPAAPQTKEPTNDR